MYPFHNACVHDGCIRNACIHDAILGVEYLSKHWDTYICLVLTIVICRGRCPMLQICGLMVCQVPRVVVSLIKILLSLFCILQFSPQILENIQLKKSKYIKRKICVRMVEQVPRVVVSLIGSSAVHRTVFLYFGNRHLIALHCCAVVCCKERERE